MMHIVLYCIVWYWTIGKYIDRYKDGTGISYSIYVCMYVWKGRWERIEYRLDSWRLEMGMGDVFDNFYLLYCIVLYPLIYTAWVKWLIY